MDFEGFTQNLASLTVNFEGLRPYFASFTLNFENFTLYLASFATDFEDLTVHFARFVLCREDSRKVQIGGWICVGRLANGSRSLCGSDGARTLRATQPCQGCVIEKSAT